MKNPVIKFFDYITLTSDGVDVNGCNIDGVHVEMTERSLKDLEKTLKFLDEFDDLKIVKKWDNYFLRDDYVIRRNAGVEVFPNGFEAYSLFRKSPYGRVEVFGGSLNWAVEQAEKRIETFETNDSETV